MLTGSVHLMMVSALVWVLSFLAQVTSVAVSALGKTQTRLYLYICIITGMYVCDVFIFIYCLCILFMTSSRRHLGGVSSSGISVMSNVMSASGWPSFSLLKNSLTSSRSCTEAFLWTILILFFFFFFLANE